MANEILVLNPDAKGIERYLHDWQVDYIRQETPKQYIKTREGAAKQRFKYVDGYHFQDALDFVFGGLWSFEVLSEKETSKGVIVKGRLTVNLPMPNGTFLEIKKEQFGEVGPPLALGDQYKGAATDAMKKCAVMLGFFRDVYMKEEDALRRNVAMAKAKEVRKLLATDDAKTTFNFPK